MCYGLTNTYVIQADPHKTICYQYNLHYKFLTQKPLVELTNDKSCYTLCTNSRNKIKRDYPTNCTCALRVH